MTSWHCGENKQMMTVTAHWWAREDSMQAQRFGCRCCQHTQVCNASRAVTLKLMKAIFFSPPCFSICLSSTHPFPPFPPLQMHNYWIMNIRFARTWFAEEVWLWKLTFPCCIYIFQPGSNNLLTKKNLIRVPTFQGCWLFFFLLFNVLNISRNP